MQLTMTQETQIPRFAKDGTSVRRRTAWHANLMDTSARSATSLITWTIDLAVLMIFWPLKDSFLASSSEILIAGYESAGVGFSGGDVISAWEKAVSFCIIKETMVRKK